MAGWRLYMLRTERGALYTGISTDVERRLAQHRKLRAGGAKSLRNASSLQLVFVAELGSRQLASRAEHRIKRLAKPAKERIVRDQPDTQRLLRMLE